MPIHGPALEYQHKRYEGSDLKSRRDNYKQEQKQSLCSLQKIKELFIYRQIMEPLLHNYNNIKNCDIFSRNLNIFTKSTPLEPNKGCEMLITEWFLKLPTMKVFVFWLPAMPVNFAKLLV